MTLLLLAACAGTATPEPWSQTISFPDGQVIDPKLPGNPTIRVDASCAGGLTYTSATGQVRHGGLEPWDGRDDGGAAFDPGAVQVVTDCESGPGYALVHVVRLGFSTLDFVSGADGGSVPLAFHKRALLVPEVVPVDGPEYRTAPDGVISALDDDGGAARALPAPWTEAAIPPWGMGAEGDSAYDVPAAYVAGAAVRVELEMGDAAISERTGAPVPALGPDGAAIPAPTLRLVADGWTAADPAWRPGGTMVLDGAPVESTLGREDRPITWRWQAQSAADSDTWVPVPGSLTTTHRLYRTAAQNTLRDGTELGFAPAITWIGVLDDLQDDVEGVGPDPAATLDAIRDHLHLSEYVVYDPNDGSYSDYAGAYIYWDYTWSDLSGWLDRDQGLHLYCHSMSCLLSTLAAQEGIRAPQQVLGVGFRTNLVRAAGTTEWMRWSFNSHSVVSPDDGATIWDASIDLDGDSDPGDDPVAPLAPKGLPYDTYVGLLTPDPISIVNSGLCYFE